MAGFVVGVIDADQWARDPRDLDRVIGDQLDDAAEMDAPGRREWVESRWSRPVLLDGPTLGRWVAGWRAEVAARKMG